MSRCRKAGLLCGGFKNEPIPAQGNKISSRILLEDPSNPQNLKFQLRQDETGLRWVVKNLEKKAKQRGGKASPDKSRQIQERAGELAMNQGKPAHKAGKQEVQRAKRELQDLKITSPQGSESQPTE